jgi:CheY-like chemotaxis protein
VPTDKVTKIVYKPINFTKILTVMDLCTQTESRGEIESASSDYYQFENIHALVAEDNVINQKLITRVLKSFGLQITIAGNGKEALELRKQNEYDVIFMDIQMPVMGGIEATQEIIRFENLNHRKHIPIIALTANALQGDKEKYLEVGMDNYASKPIDLDHINKLLLEYFPQQTVSGRQEDKEENTLEEKENVPEKKEVSQDVTKESVPKNNDISPDEEKETEPVKHELPSEEKKEIVSEKQETSQETKREIDLQTDIPKETDAVSEKEETAAADILLYHPIGMIADIYEKILLNLGYSVDRLTDISLLHEHLKIHRYRCIVHYAKPDETRDPLWMQVITESNVKELVLVRHEKESDAFECETFVQGSEVSILRDKLGQILQKSE